MSLIESWIYALWKELQDHKGKVALVFAAVTFITVVVGFVWPKQYQASAVVFADDQNIIKPLLSGSAEVTKPDIDQAAIVRDRIFSNQILGQALVEAKWAKSATDLSALDPMIRTLRGGIVVTEVGKGHIKISYTSKKAGDAYVIASAITNAFIRDAAQTKSQESREAFTFIDNQVTTYKEQLQKSEDRLKEFKGQSGALTGSSSQINQLKSELSKLTLDMQVARARRDELQRQITQERQFAGRQSRVEGFRQRLSQAKSQLDALRLSYSDTYPDIVSLKQQIQDLEGAISAAENQSAVSVDSNDTANPVYAKLRGDLADAEVNVRTLELQIASSKKMIEDEEGYGKKGAEYDAQLAELTRDYTVTKQLYEDMLGRKERARLSVALDVEGQGFNYKIKEPPEYPTVPVGLRFIHFFLLAPVIGLLAPLAILAAYIQLDPRVRFPGKLMDMLPENVPLIAVIPHMITHSERRTNRSEWMGLAIFAGVVMIIYTVVGISRIGGFI